MWYPHKQDDLLLTASSFPASTRGYVHCLPKCAVCLLVCGKLRQRYEMGLLVVPKPGLNGIRSCVHMSVYAEEWYVEAWMNNVTYHSMLKGWR